METQIGSVHGGGRGEALDDVFACLGSGERRQVLALALDRAPDAVEISTAATALATGSGSEFGSTEAPEQEALTALHHAHLPKLADAGLVEYDANGDAFALADHPAFEDSGVVDAIEGSAPGDAESLDALFGALADGRRRDVLDALSHQLGRIHVETLARELEAAETDVAESEVPPADVERTLGRLQHVDLQTLSATGLVAYDADDGTVAYEGHPALSVPWLHSVLEPDFRGSLTGETDASGIGEIEGRQDVVSFGQSLCETADDELFCMFTDTDLLEAGCLARIRNAVERGVDVYLGTRDQYIREYVRENAPEVVLWEPNTDWLNIPVAGDRVGRLVLADREAVMLGTLLEERADGVHAEQAIVGEGEDDALVTMICQLVGPHLETIDEDTAEVEAQLPL